MLKFGQDVKLPELERLQEGIATVEKRTGKSVRDFVDFGKILPGKLKVFKNSIDGLCIGEPNESNELNGRGIKITLNGNICIKRWD